MLLIYRVLSTEEEPPEPADEHDPPTTDPSNDMPASRKRAKNSDKVRWGGIHAVGQGQPEDVPAADRWSAHRRLLRPGFLSKREVLTREGVWLDVWCSVATSGNPPKLTFTCITDDGTAFSSDNPTRPCQLILRAVNAATCSSQWRGINFFGLDRHPPQLAPDNEDDEEDTTERGCSSSSKRVVQKLDSLLQRGRCVPTSELRQNRSALHRNETIHEIVDAASFGDVKSKHDVVT